MEAANSYPVLTVRQPWEFALEHGKPVENRTWQTSYRGPVWLHAGARSRWDPAGAESPLVRETWKRYLHEKVPGWPGLPSSDVELGRKTTLMPFGAVSALAQLKDCHDGCIEQGECSDWADRWQWHWVLTDVRPLPEPVPCRGMLGLWRLPEDVEKTVREQLEATDG